MNVHTRPADDVALQLLYVFVSCAEKLPVFSLMFMLPVVLTVPPFGHSALSLIGATTEATWPFTDCANWFDCAEKAVGVNPKPMADIASIISSSCAVVRSASGASGLSPPQAASEKAMAATNARRRFVCIM